MFSGVRIREERMKLNLTQEQLAEKVGVSKNFMSLIENGSNMSLETVINLANVFGVTVDHLLSDLVKGDPDQMIDQICSRLEKDEFPGTVVHLKCGERISGNIPLFLPKILTLHSHVALTA